MSKITIFTSPKPFTKNAHINVIQRNAIGSWANLGEDVMVLLIGDEEGMADVALEFTVMHYKEVRCNTLGTPMIPSMVEIARKETDSEILAFVNADVILTREFVDEALRVAALEKQYLLVGQRFDLAITEQINFTQDWQTYVKELNKQSGKLHGPSGSDYFIFPRSTFEDIPELVIGRAGWDNWMIYEARQRGWKTIDCTESIQVFHQNHDYSHLPGGQIHFRLPESNENVRAGGGFLHIFPLTDANYVLTKYGIQRRQFKIQHIWREMEIFPLVQLHSDTIGKIFFYLAHPRRGWLAAKGWLLRKIGIEKHSRHTEE